MVSSIKGGKMIICGYKWPELARVWILSWKLPILVAGKDCAQGEFGMFTFQKSTSRLWSGNLERSPAREVRLVSHARPTHLPSSFVSWVMVMSIQFDKTKCLWRGLLLFTFRHSRKSKRKKNRQFVWFSINPKLMQNRYIKMWSAASKR